MKKILCLILVFALLLSLSLNTFAMGNDYTFTSLWWQIVFSNASYLVTKTDNTTASGSFSEVGTDYLVGNGELLTEEVNGNGLEFVNVNSSNPKTSIINYYIPVDVSILPGQTYTGTFAVVFNDIPGSDVTIRCRIFAEGLSSDYNLASVTTQYFNDLNIVARPVVNSDLIAGGSGYLINVEFTNTTDGTLSVDNLYFRVASSEAFNHVYFGVLAPYGETVILPPYVEENLVSMGNTLKEQLASLVSLENMLGVVSSKLDTSNSLNTETVALLEDLLTAFESLSDNLGVSQNISQNIYNYISEPDEENEQKVAELQQALKEAKDELAEMQETLTSVTAPTLSDIDDVNKQINISINEALDNTDVSSILEKLFGNSLIITMLLSVVSIATVGYVLFGKRG